MANDNLVTQFSFDKGVIARNQNPLAYPMDALIDGLNVDLVNQSVRTRRGYYLAHDPAVSTGDLPAGTVTALFQVRFPTTQTTFMVAQVDTGTANKLYISKTALPVIDGSMVFEELYDLGTGAEVVSWAQLNDRVVLCEGKNNAPLVWGGSISSTQTEWMVPKQVLFSRGPTPQSVSACPSLVDGLNLANYSIRQVKKVAGIPHNQCAITFKAPSGTSLTLDNVSIGVQDKGPDTVATPVSLTFGGSASVTISAGGYATTDWFTPPWASSSACSMGATAVVVMDVSTGTQYVTSGAQSGEVAYTKAATNSYNSATVTGFSSTADVSYCISFFYGQAGTIDGFQWGDITEWVCDQDSSSVASVGGSHSCFVAICLDMPRMKNIFVDVGTANTKSTSSVDFKVASGSSWTSCAASFSDGTNKLFQDGNFAYSGAGYYTVPFAVVGNVPGYWFILQLISTNTDNLPASLSINRILYQAPCQPLANINSGLSDIPAAFMYVRGNGGPVNDFSIDIADYTITSYRELNDGNISDPTGMVAGEWLYCAYPDKFSSVELTFSPNLTNTNLSTLSGQYWSKTGWTALTIKDWTASAGRTLNWNGSISWVPPSDWERCDPGVGGKPIAYWVRFTVSAQISDQVAIAEVRVRPVANTLKRHGYCFKYRDRIVLVSSTAAPDQISISRALEEYGFSGDDSWSSRIGGADPIVAATELYNQGWLFRGSDLYMLNGYDPATFSMERAEIASQIPINNRVLVKAPLLEADDKAKMGFYFLNHDGVYHFTGLQLYKISESLPYWDLQDEAPYLDHSNLHKSVGIYWPSRNWAIWSVPMVLVAGGTQTTCNRLLIFDLTLQAWLPLQAISVASLCVAHDYNVSAPGKLGRPGLYGGTYDGKILKLFDDDADTDAGAAIPTRWKTGWLDFDNPALKKKIYKIQVYAQTTSPVIECDISVDGDNSSVNTHQFTRIGSVGTTKIFSRDYSRQDLQGQFFQFEWSMSEAGIVYGVEFELASRGFDDGDQ